MINQIFLQQLLSDTRRIGAATVSALERLSTRINNHILAKGNVHNMVAADLGLERVANYGPSTKQEAIDGVNNTSVLTPKRCTSWAEANVYDPIGQIFKDAADRLP